MGQSAGQAGDVSGGLAGTEFERHAGHGHAESMGGGKGFGSERGSIGGGSSFSCTTSEERLHFVVHDLRLLQQKIVPPSKDSPRKRSSVSV